MDNFRNHNEESQLFDAAGEPQKRDFVSDWPSAVNSEYDVWIRAPQSVRERRRKLVKYWMGLGWNEFGEDQISVDALDNSKRDFLIGDILRIIESSGASQGHPSVGEEFFSAISSCSSCRYTDASCSSQEVDATEKECNVADGLVGSKRSGQVQVKTLERLLSWELGIDLSQSSSKKQFQLTKIEVDENTQRAVNKRRWLKKLRSMNCMLGWKLKDDCAGLNALGQVQGTRRIQRVGVRHCGRRLKELSALFAGQDIQAHEGLIVTMKFSLDGQYLASAGEDEVVKIWQVVEDERSDTIEIRDAGPSSVYFSLNPLSKLRILPAQKANKSKSMIRTRDLSCVVFPSKVFRILERPLHVFEGHSGEILDLSWSKNNLLLSSSVDKTVRLWRVGVDQCLKVFLHSDYVTCVHFNPVNDDYFISGSIDGKVRIWGVGRCKVVNWNETRDIITAVSYRPDGQGGIIGTIKGTCRLFHLSDNHFQLEAEMRLTRKKRSPCKRITGFQFLPQDPCKVLVTCADSHVRIFDGINVIRKYRGLGRAGNQISASFTSDGRYIVSASENSNVSIWNNADQGEDSSPKPKVIKSSERFSANASVAIPWFGFKTWNSEDNLESNEPQKCSTDSLPFSSSPCVSLCPEYPSEPRSKAWPEEKLPVSNPQAAATASELGRSLHKIFKPASRAWGLVIVSAGPDGRIRSFHNYGLPVPLRGKATTSLKHWIKGCHRKGSFV